MFTVCSCETTTESGYLCMWPSWNRTTWYLIQVLLLHLCLHVDVKYLSCALLIFYTTLQVWRMLVQELFGVTLAGKDHSKRVKYFKCQLALNTMRQAPKFPFLVWIMIYKNSTILRPCSCSNNLILHDNLFTSRLIIGRPTKYEQCSLMFTAIPVFCNWFIMYSAPMQVTFEVCIEVHRFLYALVPYVNLYTCVAFASTM
jgi:hypothetical protein